MSKTHPPAERYTLTGKQAAHRARVSVQCIYRWRRTGKLRSMRRGGRYFYAVEDLDAMFQEVKPDCPQSLHDEAMRVLRAARLA